jgi:hypothetical protein
MKIKRYRLRLVVPGIIGMCGILSVGFTGCRAKSGTTPTLPEYTSLLQTRTKRATIYRGLETILSVSATYCDWPLRQAYTRKYAADHQLTPPEEQKMLEEQKKELQAGYQFIVATSTDNKDWDKLDKKDSIWRVYLINNEGLRVKPVYIKHQKPVPIYISEYYPYYSPWKKVYKILFPPSPPDRPIPLITKDTEQITLLFTSPLGKVALNWRL